MKCPSDGHSFEEYSRPLFRLLPLCFPAAVLWVALLKYLVSSPTQMMSLSKNGMILLKCWVKISVSCFYIVSLRHFITAMGNRLT